MQQPKNDTGAEVPHIPPSNFNLIDHSFRPTWDYELIEGLSDKVQALQQQGRFRSALDVIFIALDTHPDHPEALMLAMLLLGGRRTDRLQAQEPIPESYLLDTRLDPIFTVCSHCQRISWVPDDCLMMNYAKLAVWSPSGLQCYNCGYVMCRDCLQLIPFGGVGLSVPSRTCPHCHEEKLGKPVFPTGRLPHQMRRQAGSFVHVIVFREGPVPPDGEYMGCEHGRNQKLE